MRDGEGRADTVSSVMNLYLGGVSFRVMPMLAVGGRLAGRVTLRAVGLLGEFQVLIVAEHAWRW